MNDEKTFLEFLADKISEAKKECYANIGTSSFNKPYIIGDTDGNTITEHQIEILEINGKFLNEIPKQYYEQYTKLICKQMDFYNAFNPHKNTKLSEIDKEKSKIIEERQRNIIQTDLYEDYRTNRPNEVRKRIRKKIQNLREELESVEEDFSGYYDYDITYEDGKVEKASMSKEEIKERVKNSKYYTLVSLLDELDNHLNGNKNNESIAPYGKFYSPYEISKTNTLKPLFEKIIKDCNIKGASLSIKQLIDELY